MEYHFRAVSLLAALGLMAAWSITGISLSASGVARASSADDEKTEKSRGLPPLVVEKDAPLLLDEIPNADKDSADESSGPIADNSACYVCHENLREEPLVRWHTKAGTACVGCHGDSYAHRNDENNITPPDVMYPPPEIDKACKKCHHTHDVSAQKVLARFLERCPKKNVPTTIVCTDCHGRHRLKSRTVRWDKTTGKLIDAD